MTKRLCLSVVVEMPDNPFDASDVFAKLKQPWSDLLNSLTQSGVKHDFKADEMEVSAKRGRPRKPRIAAVPPSGEAA
jgi:hypothetical protein